MKWIEKLNCFGAIKMAIIFKKTEFEGLLIIKPHIFEDDRGMYVKFYESSYFFDNNISGVFDEFSEIVAKKGSLRGLHYQKNNPQGKLIKVIKGCVYDVALDLRTASKTFGQCFCKLLNDFNNEAVFIPPGFAHGFLAMKDSIFIYESVGAYDPNSSGTILWNDPALNIKWPKKGLHLIISEKDKNGKSFSDYCEQL